jgi:hypothetical protein
MIVNDAVCTLCDFLSFGQRVQSARHSRDSHYQVNLLLDVAVSSEHSKSTKLLGVLY